MKDQCNVSSLFHLSNTFFVYKINNIHVESNISIFGYSRDHYIESNHHVNTRYQTPLLKYKVVGGLYNIVSPSYCFDRNTPLIVSKYHKSNQNTIVT